METTVNTANYAPDYLRELFLIEKDGKKALFQRDTFQIFKIPSDVQNRDDAIEILKKSGLLDKPARKATAQSPETVHSNKVVLLMTNECNLKCSYCYVDTEKNLKKMTPEIALRAVDQMKDLNKNNPLLIMFFGGEPLINFKTIQSVIEHCRDWSNVSYGMVTNGTMLTPEIARFIVDNKINLSISLDGPEFLNDMTRTYKKGERGTYRIVADNIRLIKSISPSHPIAYEATISYPHIRHLKTKEDVIDWLHSFRELGFDTGIIGVANNKLDLNLDSPMQEEDVDHFARVMETIIDYSIDSLYTEHPYYVHGMTNLIPKLIKKVKRYNACQLGRNVVAVDSGGNVMPCYLFKEPEFIMGNVMDDNLFKPDYFAVSDRLIRDTHVDNLEECADCVSKYLCITRCAGFSNMQYGDYLKQINFYCEMNNLIFNKLIIKFMDETANNENLIRNYNRYKSLVLLE